MTYPVWTNFITGAGATLASNITSTQTSITLTSGQGALFPALITGQFFPLVLQSATNSATAEICWCTARSTDTLTVLRGQEGSTASAFNASDLVQLRPTAASLADITPTYVTDTGTANAVAIAVPANFTTLASLTGIPLWIVKGSSPNSGALTITPTPVGGSAFAATTTQNPDGSALISGQWPAGGVAVVIYNGSVFQFVSITTSQAAALPNAYFQLPTGCIATFAGGTNTASWSTPYGTLSFNGGTTGAGGMDTGSTPISGDLYIYAIWNTASASPALLGTIAGNGSPIYGGTHLPPGYTNPVLYAAVKTDSLGNIVAGAQSGRLFSIAETTAASGSPTGYTSVSLSGIIPKCAASIGGSIYAHGSNGLVQLSPLGSTIGQTNGSQITSSYADLAIITTQTVYWTQASNISTPSFTVANYRI